MGEYAGKDQGIELACLQFKEWELGVLQELACAVDTANGEALAYKLFVLLEGIAAIAQLMKGTCPINVTAMAAALMD